MIDWQYTFLHPTLQEVAEQLDMTLAVPHFSALASRLIVSVMHSSVICLMTVAMTLLKYALVSFNCVHFVNLYQILLFSHFVHLLCKRWIK